MKAVGNNDDHIEVLRIILARKAESEEGNTLSKIVRHDIDLANLMPLTIAQKDEVAALAVLPNSQIDHSDIPPLTEKLWNLSWFHEIMMD